MRITDGQLNELERTIREDKSVETDDLTLALIAEVRQRRGTLTLEEVRGIAHAAIIQAWSAMDFGTLGQAGELAAASAAAIARRLAGRRVGSR